MRRVRRHAEQLVEAVKSAGDVDFLAESLEQRLAKRGGRLT
jgi:hypothetical protein